MRNDKDEVGTTGWIVLPDADTPIPGGTVFDLVMGIQTTNLGTSFNGQWVYSANNGHPGDGEVFHRNDAGFIRFADTDNLGVNKKPELDNVPMGTVISSATDSVMV